MADNLPQVLSAVAARLQDSFDIIGMASDRQAALDAILTFKPDLAVMDISLPIISRIEIDSELKSRANKTKIVFLTVHEDSDSPITLHRAILRRNDGLRSVTVANSQVPTSVRRMGSTGLTGLNGFSNAVWG